MKDNHGFAMVRNHRLAGQPAVPGDQVFVYATGIDRLTNVSIQIGEFQATPAAIVAAPNHPGLFQVAFAVPDVTGNNGEFPLSLSGDAPEGQKLHSNTLSMAVEANNR